MSFSPGQKVDCRVDSLAFGGAGVARMSGMVFFIGNALPGERVIAEITQVRKRFVLAHTADILEAAPERVKPPCNFYGSCGGCQLQHLAYPAQLAWKARQVIDILERIGSMKGFDRGDVIGSPVPYGYRNSVRLHLAARKPLRYGYHSIDNQSICAINRCSIAEEPINSVLSDIERHVRLRKFPEQIILHADADGRVAISPKGGPAPVVTERLCGIPFSLPATSFFQVNRHVAMRLVELLKKHVAAFAGSGTLFDLYSGVGIFSILLESHFSSIVGIDIDRQAITHAGLNIAQSGKNKFQFMCGRVENICARLYRKYARESNVILLDPPRGGIKAELLNFLKTVTPSTELIIYVSCDPATLARDLKMLCADGRWRLENVAVLDMFPQTAHIEVCCVIGRG